jgi:hypothetical protein
VRQIAFGTCPAGFSVTNLACGARSRGTRNRGTRNRGTRGTKDR